MWDKYQAIFVHVPSKGDKSEGLFIWSRVAEITLPLSYPGRDILPIICLKNYINRLHEVRETTREGETTPIPF